VHLRDHPSSYGYLANRVDDGARPAQPWAHPSDRIAEEERAMIEYWLTGILCLLLLGYLFVALLKPEVF
jgi:K+-transporting ATPase KdpF subunit